MKKVLSVILAVVMLASIFTALPIMANALDPSGSCGENVTYTFDSSTGKLTIKGTGAMQDYYPETTPFRSVSTIKSIFISSGVTSIGQYTFYECSGLTSVSIASTVTNLKYDAFYKCTALKSIMLPEGVKTIGGQAFGSCTALESISIPKSLETIAVRAFHGCDALSKVYYAGTQKEWNAISISDEYNSALTEADRYYDAMGACGENVTYNINSATKTLTIKGKGAMYDYDKNKSPFANNVAVETIVIKDGVTSIGSYAFMTCAKVKGVNIAPSVTSIGEGAFTNCYALLFVQIPLDVTVIPDSTFYYCNSLKDVGIPATVTTIGDSAFSHCENLWTVYYWGTQSQWNSITKGSFNDQLSKVTLQPFVFSGYCGDAVYYHFFDSTGQLSIDGYGDMYDFPVEYPEYYDNYKDDIKEIYVTGVTTVGQAAFYELPNVTYACFDSTVKTISYGAFAKCPSLEYVELPDGLENIYSAAFAECPKLNEIYIPETLTSLAFDAFVDSNNDFTVTSSCKQNLVKDIIKGTNRKWDKIHDNLGDASEVKPTATTLGYTERICADCGDSIKYSFKAPTGKPSGVKCIARTAQAEKITWNKVAGVTGYQAQILNSAGKSVELKTTTANTYVFTKLASGHAYKVRVRFYFKADDGKNYFSQWTTISSPTLPKATKLTSVSGAKKAFTAKWSKQSGVTGYQIQYATNSKFTGGKVKAVKGASKYSMKVTSLKAKTTYCVRVRTFKTIGGTNYYSTWSPTKTVKTK